MSRYRIRERFQGRRSSYRFGVLTHTLEYVVGPSGVGPRSKLQGKPSPGRSRANPSVSATG